MNPDACQNLALQNENYFCLSGRRHEHVSRRNTRFGQSGNMGGSQAGVSVIHERQQKQSFSLDKLHNRSTARPGYGGSGGRLLTLLGGLPPQEITQDTYRAAAIAS